MGLIIHVDGGSRGNPGPSGAGVVIRTDGGRILHEAGYFLGRQTNNAAEYHAVIRALDRAQRCGDQPLCICSDSQLLVRQITGQYEVKSPRLARLHRQVQRLLLRVSRWSFRHIPREENRRADQLANLAMDERRDVVVFDSEAGESAAPGAEAGPQEPAESEPLPAEEQTGGAPAVPADTAVRAVRVTLARPAAATVCAAGACPVREFTVAGTLPVELCLHAAHALLPTLLAMLHTEPEEFAAVPTLTVRCDRPGCGATFHLSPVRSPNGNRRRRDT